MLAITTLHCGEHHRLLDLRAASFAKKTLYSKRDTLALVGLMCNKPCKNNCNEKHPFVHAVVRRPLAHEVAAR